MASEGKRNLLFVVAMLLAMGGLSYYFFFARDKKRPEGAGIITGEQDRMNRAAMEGGWAVGAGGMKHEVGALWLDGTQDQLLVDGTNGYLANGRLGLVVVDLSTPTRPRQLGQLKLNGYASGVAMAGRHLVVANGLPGVVVVDVSDPAKPALKGRLDTPGRALQLAASNRSRVGLRGASMSGTVCA